MISLNSVLSERTAAGSYHGVRVAPMKSLYYSKFSYKSECWEEFVDMYAKVYLHGDAHLAEMPPPVAPILIDSDMAVENEELVDLYASGDVHAVAAAVVRAMKDLFHNRDDLDSVEFMFLNKSPAWKEDNTGKRFVKHGFHLHSLNVTIDRCMYSELLDRTKSHLMGFKVSQAPELSLGSTLDDVGGKPWLLYGSSKGAGKEPYLAHSIISVDVETCDVKMRSIPPPEYSVNALVRRLSLVFSPTAENADSLRLEPLRRSDEEEYNKIAAREAYNAMDPVHRENEVEDRESYSDEDDGYLDDDDVEMQHGDADISPEQDEIVARALSTVLGALDTERSENRSAWRVVAMLVAYIVVKKRTLSARAACEVYCDFSARCPEKYSRPSAVAVFNEMCNSARRGTLGAKYTLTMLSVFVRGDMMRRGEKKELNNTVMPAMDILNLTPVGMTDMMRKHMSSHVEHSDEITETFERLKNKRFNQRRRLGADMIRAALAIIDKRRFQDADTVEIVCRGICLDALLNRITAQECLAFVSSVFSFGDPELNTPERIEATIDRYTTDARNTVYDGQGSDEMVTIGYLMGLAAADDTERGEIIRKAFPEFARTVLDTPLAEAIKRWMPLDICSHDDPTRWYEFDTTVWKQTGEFRHKLRKMAFVWFFERAQLSIIEADGCPMKVSSEDLYTKTVDITSSPNTPAGGMYKYINSSRGFQSLERTMDTVCRADPQGSGMMMDSKKSCLAFKNVTYDNVLRAVRPGCARDHLTRRLEADYIAEADLDADTVAFIDDFFAKIHPRADKREYFLNSLANIFSGSNPWKQYMVWTGAGNNGKSVCVKLFEKMLGPDLSWKLAKGVIVHSNDPKKGPQPELVRLRAARMAFTDEVTQADRIDCGLIKLLSGNDTIPCRDLYKSSERIILLDPAFLPVIVCNELPVMHKPDQAAWERMRIFEFESTFSSDIPDTLKKIDNGMSKANRNFVFPKDASVCDRLYDPKTISTFASMLLHRYLRNVDNEALCNVVPRCVREGEIAFTMSQNLVFRTLSKKFQLRSPFDKHVTGDDDSESEGATIDFAADGFTDSVALDEIVTQVNMAFPKIEITVRKIKDATYSLACAYAPYLVWEDDVLYGVKRIGS